MNFATGKRIDLLDALRGITMLGIMLVNFPSMNSFCGKESFYYGGIRNHLDQIAARINFDLFNGKFYPIFAMLFGLGLYIFYENLKKKELSLKILVRRLIILFCLGFFHILFVWCGDILLLYSLWGLVALLFLNSPVQRIFKVAFGLLIIYPMLIIIFSYFAFKYSFALDVPIFTGFGSFNFDANFLYKVYSEGSFFQIAKQRILDYTREHTFLLGVSTILNFIEVINWHIKAFGSILFGILIGKMQWHKNIANLDAQIKKLWLFLACLNIIAVFVILSRELNFLYVDPHNLSDEFMTFFYIISFVIFLKKIQDTWFFNYFRSVGKMSLTAYILHTSINSILLYGYGFRLFEKIGPFFLLMISLATYSMIGVACVFWLKKFQFGPLEYLWRYLTYKNSSIRFQPKALDAQPKE